MSSPPTFKLITDKAEVAALTVAALEVQLHARDIPLTGFRNKAAKRRALEEAIDAAARETVASYDPAKSQATADKLAMFVNGQLEHDITSVPGIAEGGARILAACDDAIDNTFQLMGKFLIMKRGGMSSQQHCDSFVRWLQAIGINSHRSTITKALLEKAGNMLVDMHADAKATTAHGAAKTDGDAKTHGDADEHK